MCVYWKKLPKNRTWCWYKDRPGPYGASFHSFPMPLTLLLLKSTLWGPVHTKMKPDEERWGLTHTLPNRLFRFTSWVFCGCIFTHPSYFGFQCVSLSDRVPRGGTELALEVNPEPETNLTLLQTDRQTWRQTHKTLTVWLTNMQQHAHITTLLPVGTYMPPLFFLRLSAAANIAAWPVLLPRLSSPITCSLSDSDRQGY